MNIIDHRAKPRGKATRFNVATVGMPPLRWRHLETYEVTSAPPRWASSPWHWHLEPGARILVDWSQRPDEGAIGAVRVHDGVSFIVFDGLEPAIGRLVNPARLLEL